MASDVIKACRARNVDIIVAPYEADAQLAFLNLCGIAQVVITEDSDLVLFGCKACLFKLDSNGGGVMVEQEKLHLAMNVPRDKFFFDKFRNMCILSGCDYLPSLHGIGLAKAYKFFNVTSNPDINNALCKLPSYLKMPHLEVSQEYRDNFIKARNTFLHQLVFDPIQRILRPLNDYPEGMDAVDYPYAGKFVGHERALQIALGNVNVQTGEVADNFSPETYKPPEPKSSSWNKRGDLCSNHPSIWTKNFTKMGPVVPSIINSNVHTMKGKEVTVVNPMFKRRKLEPEVVDDDLTEGELHDLYSHPEKRKRTEVTPDDDSLHDDSGNYTGLGQLSDSLDMDENANTSPPITSVEKNRKSSVEMQCVSSPDQSSVEMQYVSSPDQLKSRNPFAKSKSVSKMQVSSGGQFSALKKFSKIQRTVVDQNIIVHSRYFASSDIKTTPLSHASPPVINNTLTEELSEPESQRDNEEVPGNRLEIKFETSPSKLIKTPLSPVQTNTPPSKPSKTFIWGKLSDMFARTKEKTIKIENSAATKNTFKPVTQPEDKIVCKENTFASCGNSESEELSLSLKSHVPEISFCSDADSLDSAFDSTTSSLPSASQKSQVSEHKFCSDIDSLDNFDLTSSLPLVPEETETTPTLTSPVRTKLTSSRNDHKCRTPGLFRSNKKKNKNQLGVKQLSLKDMFAFKKDGAKLQAVRSSF
ncbi:exonuclease 1 isoform X2 [Cherax quadricarinatus]